MAGSEACLKGGLFAGGFFVGETPSLERVIGFQIQGVCGAECS